MPGWFQSNVYLESALIYNLHSVLSGNARGEMDVKVKQKKPVLADRYKITYGPKYLRYLYGRKRTYLSNKDRWP